MVDPECFECMFPFSYDGHIFEDCTDYEHTDFWCATAYEPDDNGNTIILWTTCPKEDCASGAG